MKNNPSSCLFDESKFAIVQRILQIPVVQMFLEPHEDNGQQFSSRGTQGFARTLLYDQLFIMAC